MKKPVAMIIAAAMTGSPAAATGEHPAPAAPTATTASHPYVGMWVTGDGLIRHELLANGRYIEARGKREKAYQGRYEVEGNHIEYWDDTGFTADGDFIDDVLHHGGMILYRR